MTRSSEDIEREVEESRGDLDRTLEALKDKMTPGQLIDELTHSLKGSSVGDMFANLGGQVKENPLALAMVGAGMAWLMMGKSRPAAAGDDGWRVQASAFAANRGDEAFGAPEMTTRYDGGQGDAAAPDDPGLVGRAVDAAVDAVAKVSDAAADLQDRATGAAAQARHGAQDLGDKAAWTGRKVQRSFLGALDQEPLIVGAVGLAVGMAIGAALPATPVEDRTFGGLRDRVLDKGKAAGEEALQGARHAASAALDAAQHEADQQGLTTPGESLVDKAESVVRAGVEAGRSEIEAGRAH